MKIKWIIILTFFLFFFTVKAVEVNVDPNVYYSSDIGKEPTKETVTYTYNTETHCISNICTAYIGWSYAYDTDGKWKLIDNATSLRNSNIKCSVNSDSVNLADCLDWNMTSITVDLSSKNALSLTNVPIKIYTPNPLVTKPTGDYKKDYKIKNNFSLSFLSINDTKTQTIPFSFGDILEFGSNSTIITLNESNNGNVGDTFVAISTTTYNYGKWSSGLNEMVIESYSSETVRIFILWNLSGIPAGSTINNANFSLYTITQPSAARNYLAYNTSPMNTTGTTYWNEGSLNGAATSGVGANLDHNMTWNNQPFCGTANCAAPTGDVLQDNRSTTTTNTRTYWNVTNAIITSYANATYPRMSIMLRDNAESSSTDIYTYYGQKEYAAASQRPQLVVTYTKGAGDTTPPTYNVVGTNNTSPLPLAQVLYYSNWTDNVALSHWIFSWNGTGTTCGTWANDTAVAFNSGTWTNVTHQVPLACAGNTVDYEFYANDTSNNWNVTTMNAFSEGTSNCWTCDSTNHVLTIPTGCVYSITSGSVLVC